MERTQRIAVIGGGISGLSAAFYLRHLSRERSLNLEIEILEKSSRLGGVIRSERKDGLLFEGGPEGWASYKPSAKALIKVLKSEAEVMGSNDERRKTFVVRQGELRTLPAGMAFFAPVEPVSFWKDAPLTFGGKLRASMEPFVPRSKKELSVREFFERRLGPEFTEVLVEPMISAVYGANFAELSAESSLPELFRVEQKYGSLWRGMRRFASMTSSASVLHTMRGGMQALVEQLVQELREVPTKLDLGDLQLSRAGDHYVVKGERFEGDFDWIVLCTPAYASARMLAALAPESVQPLEEIPYASSTVSYLVYNRSEFSHPLDGFGFIVPSSEPLMINACTWVSTKFDHRCPPDKILLRCAIHGGAEKHGLTTDEEIVEKVHGELEQLMNIRCSPIDYRVFTSARALPRLMVGHKKRLAAARAGLTAHPQIRLAGSYMKGVGVPDCIGTGQETATSIIEAICG